MFERVTAGLAIVQREFAGRSVVLVAHGFVAKVIRALLTEMSWDEFFRYALNNGQVASYALGQTAICGPAWGDFMRPQR